MKGIKKYLKDNLGIILALVAMILFLYVYPKTHNTFLTTNNIFNVLRQSATNLMPPRMMTIVMPQASIRLVALCRSTLKILLVVRNVLWVFG